MNCHVQLCGPLPTHSLHRYSCLLVCNALCHQMSQGFHIMGLLCHITGSATLQVCCVTSQGLSCHGFVASHHRVCHAPGLLHHITGSVMLHVCCVTSQGLSCHRFVMSYHRVCHKVCHAPGLLCHITGCVTPQVCCVTSQGLSESVMPQFFCVTSQGLSQGLSRHRFVVLHHRVCWKARWEYAVEVTICKSCHLPFTAEGQCITFMLLCWTKLQGNEKWMHVWLHQALKWGHMSGLTVYQTLKCEHAPCLTVCQALK